VNAAAGAHPGGVDGADLDLGLADALPVPDGAVIVLCVLIEARSNGRLSSAATGPRPPWPQLTRPDPTAITPRWTDPEANDDTGRHAEQPTPALCTT